MYYKFTLKRSGKVVAGGWLESCNSRIVATSPAYGAFANRDVCNVIAVLRQRGYDVHVYENRDASKRKHNGRTTGRLIRE